MARPRSLPIATAGTVLGALLLTALPASAAPPPGPGPHPVRERGGSEPAAPLPPRTAALSSPVVSPAARPASGGYPRRTALAVPPENPADASLKLGLAPYHSLAPRLNALQRLGDRVSVEVVGRSAGGRELYLVTVTAPESPAQARAQERMRERIENAPAAAAGDARIKAAYKTPVFINNNIHGNEWEGTDAALRLVEELATATDRKTAGLLARTRIHLNVTANPDGRIAGTRANAAGFDLNRDFITASQPESRAIRRIAIDKQPAVMLDLHGYVNGTLIEPTTPPHGENYEYDLFLKHSYANALGMERAVNGLGHTPAKDGVEPAVIPFRDQREGWDDWPPIFTPQYMPFQGAVAAHTIEFPLQVNNRAYQTLPVAELRRRAAINVGIAGAVMRAALDYADTHRAAVIADQIETFRRGAAGEPQRPVSEETVPGVPGIGPEDVYTTTFPRAYVIPAGRAQRSAVAAARLVDHLVANDVRVGRAKDGSYVVDMRQPKRGLANVILAEGRDISADVSTMYDISGWSLGLLWGATVRKVERGPVPAVVRTVHAAAPTGSVAPFGDLLLRLDDPKELVAVNALLARGVAVRRTADGAAVVPGAARAVARELAERYGVVFRATKERGAAPLERTRVAASATAGELFALREMGFEVVPVSAKVLNAGFDWSGASGPSGASGADVLYVSQGLDWAELTPAAREALRRSGVGVVGAGAAGAAFNAAAGLLPVTAVEGNGDANGVVAVRGTGGPLAAGAPAHTFVYSPLWFTGLGAGVRTELAYAPGAPLVSGHWRPAAAGGGGPADAAGRAAVVSGRAASGAPVVLIGTEPLFRTHPKGSFALVGRALLAR
ncbi:M14 family zinc carboxypeptidase [Streptomyces sp. NPDC006339]|uniref:M14 family zinc carboxypeptidase n=1 Tax=Streptomyces sp. NPDC006339 TaxID=3156755 RepID=UPI0033BBAD84